MIQGIIFDFDGLILDTEITIYQSWQEVYAANCASRIGPKSSEPKLSSSDPWPPWKNS